MCVPGTYRMTNSSTEYRLCEVPLLIATYSLKPFYFGNCFFLHIMYIFTSLYEMLLYNDRVICW
uniref:Uncharacterized protein n=1 Tax=Octopus bimaculoides TaxID=37653 RepID=A0A0L8FPE6_OCTBM